MREFYRVEAEPLHVCETCKSLAVFAVKERLRVIRKEIGVAAVKMKEVEASAPGVHCDVCGAGRFSEI